jgi:uncharacterized protein (TIGR03067 family)
MQRGEDTAVNKPIVSNLLVAALALGLAAWAGYVGVCRVVPLAEPPVDAEHAADWVARLSDRDPAVRMRAKKSVMQIGGPAVPFLVPLAQGDDVPGKHEAIRALIDIRDEAAVAPLVHLMKTGDPRLRREAIEAVGRIGPGARAAVADLMWLVRSGEFQRVEKIGGTHFITMALVQILGEEAVPHLVEMLQHPELRRDAVRALELDCIPASRAALPALEQAARDETPGRRPEILAAIEIIRLSGTWVLTGIEHEGKATPPNESRQVQWTIHANEWTKRPANGAVRHGYFSIQHEEMTRSMCLSESLPYYSPRANTEFTYELDGDTLTIRGRDDDTDQESAESETPDRIFHWKRIAP